MERKMMSMVLFYYFDTAFDQSDFNHIFMSEDFPTKS